MPPAEKPPIFKFYMSIVFYGGFSAMGVIADKFVKVGIQSGAILTNAPCGKPPVNRFYMSIVFYGGFSAMGVSGDKFIEVGIQEGKNFITF